MVAPDLVTHDPIVKINGAPLDTADAEVLLDLRVDCALNEVGKSTLQFAGSIGDLKGPWGKLGAELRILDHTGKTIFFGHLTGVEVTHHANQPQAITIVTAHDPAHRLGGQVRVKTWQKQKASDVISTLVQEAGLKSEVAVTTITYDYLIQTGSDLDHLDELVARAGMAWWWDDSRLCAKKVAIGSVTATTKLPLDQLSRVAVRASAIRPSEVSVRGWAVDNKEVTGKASFNGDFVGATGQMADRVVKYTAHQQPHNLANVAVITQEEATMLAKAALGRAASGAVHAEFEGPGLWSVGPGAAIELDDGGGDLAGKYLVTAVEHRWTKGVGTSRIVSGDQRSRSGARNSPSPGTPTIVVGRVTDVNDPDKKGRVRVAYPGLDGGQQSDWARVLLPGAGANRGSTVLPDVKDEVLLTFEGGDMRKAVVLGSLYTKQSTLPINKHRAGAFERTTLASRHGHAIVMWKEAAKQGIEIKLANGGIIRISDAGTELIGVPGKKTSIVQGQSKIEMTDQGDITIEGMNITMKAKVKIAAEAQVQMDLISKAMLKAEGAMVNIKGTGPTNVSSDGPLALKGAIVQIN